MTSIIVPGVATVLKQVGWRIVAGPDPSNPHND